MDRPPADAYASAAALYIAIKRHADYQTGVAEVSNNRLCKAIGVSKPTFYKARQSLLENGLISIVGDRFPSRYVVHEQLCHYAADRTPVARTTFPYIPSLQSKVLEALRVQPLTLDQIGTTVTIGTVNIQVINISARDPVEKKERP
ncbi:helix-turn-helix domain-containing protein [Nitrospirillum sp. BR 11828]|uniref:helix-turn-helix domain-containing protein n=1 Tax=Nitrospirillum sp. BR 11828 TaxID=3104325 RepID=UPI002ACADAB5|nr:helix-turn-helix domain-containing protein [Nitrospirillum sp. BR 11828]MDZ5646976.1 helix-turn-helix domain-containing protein [Nitrospirillum sp. BR 11828]